MVLATNNCWAFDANTSTQPLCKMRLASWDLIVQQYDEMIKYAAALKQQVAMLRHSVKRPRAAAADKIFWILFSRYYVERVIGSIRRECLDHVIVLNERHLRRILRDYVDYYHSCRTHLSLCKDPPDSRRAESVEAGNIAAVNSIGFVTFSDTWCVLSGLLSLHLLGCQNLANIRKI